MDYAEYQADIAYTEKQSGASVRIVLYDEDDPTTALIGNLTGLSSSDDMEQIPIEEAGADGVDEIVTGRHTGNGSLNGFFTPERNDGLPNRQDFLGDTTGKKYTIMQVVGEGRTGIDVPLNVFVGCKISRIAFQQGARGAISFDATFLFTRRYNGAQWAALTAG